MLRDQRVRHWLHLCIFSRCPRGSSQRWRMLPQSPILERLPHRRIFMTMYPDAAHLAVPESMLRLLESTGET
jgi:hypothetical protein